MEDFLFRFRRLVLIAINTTIDEEPRLVARSTTVMGDRGGVNYDICSPKYLPAIYSEYWGRYKLQYS